MCIRDSRYTLSFDLLYHGLEITTGGQRIHDYNMLIEKIAAKGMDQEGLEPVSYTHLSSCIMWTMTECRQRSPTSRQAILI